MARTNWKQRALNAERALSEVRAILETFDLANDVASKVRTSNKPKQHPETKPAVDYFHRKYLDAYGVKPTWDGKTIKMVDELVRKHGLAQVTLRVDNLFEGLLDWLSPPYTVPALRQHFDKLIKLDEADPATEWTKVADLVRKNGRDLRRAQMQFADLNPRTRRVISQWGWHNICAMNSAFAEREFIRRWHRA